MQRLGFRTWDSDSARDRGENEALSRRAAGQNANFASIQSREGIAQGQLRGFYKKCSKPSYTQWLMLPA